MKRFIYFIYYLREINIKKATAFLYYAHSVTGRPRLLIIIDSLKSSFKYNISILDYYYFRFFSKTHFERLKWAGTGFMYEFQLRMNPPSSRSVLQNKIEFMKTLSALIGREYAKASDLEASEELASKWLLEKGTKIVVKNSKGQVGSQVAVVETKNFTTKSLIQFMKKNDFDLIEEFIQQHPALHQLSPSGLNTVRVVTQLHQGKVIMMAARLRISINSMVDNLAAGNVAAPIDIKSGIVTGPAIYSDITKDTVTQHPITKLSIVHFEIPFWQSVLTLVESAALQLSDCRSIGWDVAITINGPVLVEGNHNWCKLLWQLPVNKGLKSELEVF
ncbi:MAG: sugar-transfer associated ATP-grasp domain-containing protein [Cyclobacteriaceae bacterium]|jgi:hypothetical protein